MRILIADDHDLLRDVLRSYLEVEGCFVVETVANLREALEAIRSNDTPFDLIVLDYGMPGMNGYRGLEQAIAASQGQPVALMSGLAPSDVADKVLGLGAAGFLPKTLPARSLVNAIRFMAAGETFMPVDRQRVVKPDDAAPSNLSARELQVLALLCAGKPNKEIAQDLDLSEAAIKLHVKMICRKLDARNRTHAAMIARELALC